MGFKIKKFFNPVANVLSGGMAASIPFVPGVAEYYGEKEAREADQASAQKQMDFQERMSSTAHQREVADLQKAGINPVLSANSGASTPAGSGIDAENMFRGIQPAIASAFALKKMKADIDNTEQATRESKVRTQSQEQGLGSKFIGTNLFQKIIDKWGDVSSSGLRLDKKRGGKYNLGVRRSERDNIQDFKFPRKAFGR